MVKNRQAVEFSAFWCISIDGAEVLNFPSQGFTCLVLGEMESLLCTFDQSLLNSSCHIVEVCRVRDCLLLSIGAVVQ